MSKTRVELSYSGIGEILRSEEMAACVRGEAGRIFAALGDGYASDTYHAGTRVIASVFTETKDAAKDNSENNSLLKAVSK